MIEYKDLALLLVIQAKIKRIFFALLTSINTSINTSTSSTSILYLHSKIISRNLE